MERSGWVDWVNEGGYGQGALKPRLSPRLKRYRKKSFDASPKLVYLDLDGNSTTNPQDQLRPEIRLESALRSLKGRDDGGGSGSSSGSERGVIAGFARIAQGARARATALLEFAQEHSLVLDPEAFADTVVNGRKYLGDGSEHTVFFDKTSVRVIKITHGDFVGNGSVGQSTTVTSYLESLLASNKLFGDDVRLEGIVSIEGEFPQLVISQPFSKGRPATSKEIHGYMTSNGFKFVDGSWRKGGIIVSDVVPKNVMALDEKNGSVTVVPFDVQVVESGVSKSRIAEASHTPQQARATDQDVAAAFRNIVDSMRTLGVDSRLVKQKVADLVAELGRYEEFDGKQGQLVRIITLAMADANKPTFQNFITLLHEVGHSFMVGMPENVQAQLHTAIRNSTTEALGIDPAFKSAEEAGSDAERQEERIVEGVAQRMAANGFDPASSRRLMRSVMRMLKAIYYRTAMKFAELFNIPISQEMALSYVQNRIESGLVGGYSLIAEAGGIVDSRTRIQMEDDQTALVDPVFRRFRKELEFASNPEVEVSPDRSTIWPTRSFRGISSCSKPRRKNCSKISWRRRNCPMKSPRNFSPPSSRRYPAWRNYPCASTI